MTTRSVIIASAGSGKTFTLANRLIGWMVHRLRTEGEPGCDRLLASTFTRKAAGEILERVLQHLAQGVLDDEARSRYADSFGLSTCPTRDELRTVLLTFIRLLHRVQINTLDGVFHRICQCFAAEIGLPANWTIGDDSSMERLRAECINEVLDAVDGDSMTLLIKLMQRGQRKRSVHASISRKIWGGGYGSELLQIIRATSMTPDPAAPWNWLKPAADGSALDGGRPLDPTTLARAIDVLEEAPIVLKKDGTPNSYWFKNHKGMVSDLRAGDWESFLERAVTAVCSTRIGDTFARNLPDDELIEAVAPLVVHAKACCINGRHEELVATHSILGAIETVYRKRQYRVGLYTFGDIEQLLAECGVIRRDALGLLWFRLDGMVRDLAFDEFQDTSTRQYKVLEPLIEEVLSGEGGDVDRGFLVLADPKQSIYGWRGGTPGLIDDLERDYANRMDEEPPLVRSWRSSSVVLDAVDRVFGSLEENAALQQIDHAMDGVRAWLRNYSRHEAARDLPGCVQVLVPDAGTDKPTMDHALEMAVELIVDRHTAAPGRTIGVLVSRNKTVTRLVAALRKAGVDASEEGSSLLVDSPAVLAMLSLFHLADHPGDVRSLFHVSATPLAPLLDIDPLDVLDAELQRRCARRVSLEVRQGLLEHGYGAYVQRLVTGLEPFCTARDVLRLHQLVELAEAWDPQATLEPVDFIRYIESTPRSTAAVSNVQIMTVHKSKGLEFDEVVLPELNRNFMRTSDSLYLHRERPTGPPTRVVPRMSKELSLHFPTISDECMAARARESIQDALSVLYVAMTRARNALHMVLLPLSDDSKTGEPITTLTGTAAGVLRAALPELNRRMIAHEERDEPVLWSHGASSWSTAAAPTTSNDSMVLERPTLAASGRVRRTWVSPSSKSERSVADRLGADRFAPMIGADRGTLIHELFRHVLWIEDGVPDSSAIEAALAATARMTGGPMPTDRRDEAIDAFKRALEHDAVRHRLSRSAYGGRGHDELLVWRERPIQIIVDDEVVNGRFDRVVIGRLEGRPIWADIVDYKSDWVGDDGGAALLKRYGSQLQGYADALVRLLSLEPDHVTARLLCTGPGLDLQLPAT